MGVGRDYGIKKMLFLNVHNVDLHWPSSIKAKSLCGYVISWIISCFYWQLTKKSDFFFFGNWLMASSSSAWLCPDFSRLLLSDSLLVRTQCGDICRSLGKCSNGDCCFWYSWCHWVTSPLSVFQNGTRKRVLCLVTALTHTHTQKQWAMSLGDMPSPQRKAEWYLLRLSTSCVTPPAPGAPGVTCLRLWQKYHTLNSWRMISIGQLGLCLKGKLGLWEAECSNHKCSDVEGILNGLVQF